MRDLRINPPKFYFVKFWRVNLILILIFVFGAAIIGRLFFLQILNHDFYRALAQGQQKLISPIQGERGKIFLKDYNPPPTSSHSQSEWAPGQILATNIKGKFLYISPREIEKDGAPETAKVLAETLNLDENWILEKTKKDNLFEPIKYKLTGQEINLLKKLNLPGVYLGEEVWRNYPQGPFAPQVIGFLGGDGKGQYGIEGFYGQILQGKEGFQEKTKFSLTPFSIDSINNGADLFLTLDYNIQFMAEKLLKEAKETRDFEEGTIIVIDPNLGKILALANFPNFDPNQYSSQKNLEIFQNSAIQKIFEPGSVLKPITMAAALNEGKITPETTYVDQGFVKIGGYTITNYQNRIWGESTMTKVLEKSINTGAVFVEKQLGHDLFLKYLEKFGFFEKTGIDLQGEVFSQNSEFKKGYEINFATASFGQGIEMTPIQLVRAFSVIANSGKLVKPYLVDPPPLLDSFQETSTKNSGSKSGGGQVISQKTASQVTAMMVSTVENGFGKRAKIPGYYIAGKTGTAQIPWSALGEKKPGYSEKTIQSFVGFAPAFDPQFLILVMLKDPKVESAAYSVAPIFKELAKYIINYYQIPPDYE